jgi:hypothetical protein
MFHSPLAQFFDIETNQLDPVISRALWRNGSRVASITPDEKEIWVTDNIRG